MLRLRKPTRRTVHLVWLVAAALVALVLTRGIAIPVFVGVFFVVWLLGYSLLVRFYD